MRNTFLVLEEFPENALGALSKFREIRRAMRANQAWRSFKLYNFVLVGAKWHKKTEIFEPQNKVFRSVIFMNFHLDLMLLQFSEAEECYVI